MSESFDSLPTQASVQRAATAERLPFGPTDSLRFVADGGPGLPEFYEERAARGDGPPLHSHPWPSWELVLEGSIRFVVDGDTHVLEAGDSIYIPPGAPHTYMVESETAHAVGIGLSAGRFPSLQRKAVPLMAAEGGPSMDALMELTAAHDTAILGPPLAAAEAAEGSAP
jgi:hypothetical protein